MSDFTLQTLDALYEKRLKEDVTAEYKPDEFWFEYGKEYHKRFDLTNKDPKAFSSLFLNMPALLGRINQIKPKRVLEVGCGFGRCLGQVAELCPSVESLVGLEFSPTMLDRAVKYLKTYHPKGKHKIELWKGSAQELPFKDEEFDLVYTHACFTHIPPKDIPKCCSEVARVAKNYILQIERFRYPYEHANPHVWSHLLVPIYLELGWELVESDVVNEKAETNVILLRR